MVKKRKASTLEYERLQLSDRRNRSIRIEQPWRKKKPFQDTEKNEHFLYILPLQIMPTMRQKKKKSIFKLFHPQNKTTENLNLRIKRSDFEVERIVGLDVNYGLNGKNIFDAPSKKNWLSITNLSLIFDKQPSTWSHSTLLEPLKDCTHWKNEEDDAEVRKFENH